VPRGWELNSEQVRYYCDAALVAGVEPHEEELANKLAVHRATTDPLIALRVVYSMFVDHPETARHFYGGAAGVLTPATHVLHLAI
jgi:hypothetical protein